MHADTATTARFAGRSKDYDRARPGYPPALLQVLLRAGALPRGGVVVDVGAGTGRLSGLFLGAGYPVLAVEPEPDMLARAHARFARQGRFAAALGTAERLPVGEGRAGLIVAGTAFHWFDAPTAVGEFRRALVPGGQAALVWNYRDETADSFLAGYEAAMRTHCPGYAERRHRRLSGEALAAHFEPGSFTEHSLPNEQRLDWHLLVHRVRSSSYVPADGPAWEALLADLQALFEREQEEGSITFRYQTRVFCGIPRG